MDLHPATTRNTSVLVNGLDGTVFVEKMIESYPGWMFVDLNLYQRGLLVLCYTGKIRLYEKMEVVQMF